MIKKAAPIMIIAAGSLWGMLGIFVRSLDAYGFTSLEITCLRSLVTFLLILAFLLCYDKNQLKIRKNDLWMFAGSGILSIAFFSFCYFKTITLSSLSAAAVLLYTAPVFAVFLSAILFKETVSRIKILALVLAVTGCAFTTGLFGGDSNLTVSAVLFGLGAGFGYSLYSIFGKFALKKYSALTLTFYTFVFSFIATLLMAHPVSLAGKIASHPKSILTIILCGIFSGVVPYILYTFGLGYTEAGRASILASIEPVMATCISVLYFGEPLGLTGVCGIVLVLAALVIMNYNHTDSPKTDSVEKGF